MQKTTFQLSCTARAVLLAASNALFEHNGCSKGGKSSSTGAIVRDFELSFKEFADLRGIDAKEAKKKLKSGAEELRAHGILIEGFEQKERGRLKVHAFQTMAQELSSKCFYLQLSSDCFRIDFKRHPLALGLYYFLCSVQSIQHTTNKTKAGWSYVTFETLGKRLGFGCYTGSNITRSVISPIMRDLDYLQDLGLLKWQWKDQTSALLTFKAEQGGAEHE